LLFSVSTRDPEMKMCLRSRSVPGVAVDRIVFIDRSFKYTSEPSVYSSSGCETTIVVIQYFEGEFQVESNKSFAINSQNFVVYHIILA
jgi:hypothetical protein